jgi:hypothetical protein
LHRCCVSRLAALRTTARTLLDHKRVDRSSADIRLLHAAPR